MQETTEENTFRVAKINPCPELRVGDDGGCSTHGHHPQPSAPTVGVVVGVDVGGVVAVSLGGGALGRPAGRQKEHDS